MSYERNIERIEDMLTIQKIQNERHSMNEEELAEYEKKEERFKNIFNRVAYQVIEPLVKDIRVSILKHGYNIYILQKDNETKETYPNKDKLKIKVAFYIKDRLDEYSPTILFNGLCQLNKVRISTTFGRIDKADLGDVDITEYYKYPESLITDFIEKAIEYFGGQEERKPFNDDTDENARIIN